MRNRRHRRIFLLALLAGCVGGSDDTVVKTATLGGNIAVSGYVVNFEGIHEIGLPARDPDEQPTYVQFYTYDAGEQLSATTLITLIAGEFSGDVTAGDSYRADVLDADQNVSAAGVLVAEAPMVRARGPLFLRLAPIRDRTRPICTRLFRVRRR